MKLKLHKSGYHLDISKSEFHFTKWPDHIAKFNLCNFLLITNVTTNEVIYQFNDPDLGGTLDEQKRALTLKKDISGMSDTDVIQVFIDTEPAMHILDKDGNVSGSDNAPLHVRDEYQLAVLGQVLKELRKMNLFLAEITDERITDMDLNGD